MVTRFGMTEALGLQVYGSAQHEVFLGRDYTGGSEYSEETARRIDEEISRIMESAHEIARQILSERREQIELMVDVLVERETIEGEALKALLDNTWAEYLEDEEEILSQKAEQLRQQEIDDAEKAAENLAIREREEQEREKARQAAASEQAERDSSNRNQQGNALRQPGTYLLPPGSYPQPGTQPPRAYSQDESTAVGDVADQSTDSNQQQTDNSSDNDDFSI
jgi:cell division protease FtsH